MTYTKRIKELEEFKESVYQMRMWSANVLDAIDKELITINNKEKES